MTNCNINEECLVVIPKQVLMDGVGGAYTSTLKQYRAKAEYFFCACLQKNNGYNVERTPGFLNFFVALLESRLSHV